MHFDKVKSGDGVADKTNVKGASDALIDIKNCNDDIEEQISSLLDYYHTRNIDKDTPVYSSFIDLKAAFDSLDHNLLMKFIEHKLKLKNDSKLLSYLKASYQNMNYCVRQDGAFSSCQLQNVGTKQGCTLSPLLLIIFFNLIVEELKAVAGNDSSHQLDRKFVDDALILVYADDLCINTPNKCLFNALNGHLHIVLN